MNTEGEWTRSETFQADLLHLFESSDFFDCSFNVIPSQNPDGAENKEFKCHKVVLAASSCVFSKMLMGKFKEAHLAADEPIPIQNVAPEVFEGTMRFLYGQEENFKNMKFAMEVYKFAHEMQITSLMFAVNEFFKTAVGSNDVLEVFDFCIQYENKHGMQICKELLQGINLSEALMTQAWLTVSEALVLEVLQMDQLNVSEKEVLEALIKWGRAQVKADGHELSDGAELGRKIKSSLKFIRWAKLSTKQFTDLCQGDLGEALDGELKFQILICIIRKDWSKLPAQLQPVCLEPRIKQQFALELNEKLECYKKVFVAQSSSSCFSLQVKKRCCFVGLKFIPVAVRSFDDEDLLVPTSMQVTKEGLQKVLSKGNCLLESKPHYSIMLDSACVLEKDVWYTIHFQFPDINFSEASCEVFKEIVGYRKNQLTVYVEKVGHLVSVNELVFKMVN